MKPAENNEIDRLLRGLARSERAAGAAHGLSSETTEHLDADELNSYAEGMLPAATHARYTAHLVDCDDCRAIATQLSITAGRHLQERTIEESAGAASTWKQKLAALFSLQVMRYAGPALALLVVAFAFFAWRGQRREASTVAFQQQAERPSAVKTEENPTERAQSQNGAITSKSTEPRAQKPQTTAGDAGTTNEKKAERESQKSEAGASGNANATGQDKDTSNKEAAAAEERKSADAPATPPPPSKPATAADVKQQPARAPAEQDAQTRDALAKRSEEETKSNPSGYAGDRGPARKTEAARAKSKSESTVGAATATASNGRRADDEESGTRTVAGRRFQRRGGAWVDVEYVSSRSTTNVTRGSEQYRALVGDEPAIGIIAQQLSGEVIVIWKGRAYRIQ